MLRIAVAVGVTALLSAAGCGKKKTSTGTSTSTSTSTSTGTGTGTGTGTDAAGVPVAAAFEISVDPRVELVSIVARMAGMPEFSKTATPYAAAVDAHFAPMRAHATVAMMKMLRQKYGISNNAVPGLAMYLDQRFQPIRALKPLPPGLDSRWAAVVEIDEWVTALQTFAADSRFAEFMTAQAGTHEAARRRFATLLEGKPIIAWFDGVFGVRARARYHVMPGMLTGTMNFGVRAVSAAGDEEVGQVVFLENPDADGLPQPSELTMELLVHELGHSYVNPMLEPHMKALEPLAAPLFAKRAELMTSQKYVTFDIMLNESVVRAVVLVFLQERSTPQHTNETLRRDNGFGFTWVQTLGRGLARVRRDNGGKLPEAAVVETLRAALAAQGG